MTFGARGVPTARVRGPSYRFLSAERSWNELEMYETRNYFMICTYYVLILIVLSIIHLQLPTFQFPLSPPPMLPLRSDPPPAPLDLQCAR